LYLLAFSDWDAVLVREGQAFCISRHGTVSTWLYLAQDEFEYPF
jgi:hypothetical protein